MPDQRRSAHVVEGTASRDEVIKRGIGVGGAVLGAGALIAGLPRLASSASPAQDASVLNFILMIEDMQSALYAEALDRGRLRGELRRFAQIVGAHEREHVRFIRKALGGKARPRPALDFGTATSDADEFTAAAITLEDTGVSAYNGQAANLTTAALQAAAKVVSVEARHAAWIRDIAGRPPAAEPTDAAMSERQVRDVLEKTGFLK
jgi:Ferritin-like domain